MFSSVGDTSIKKLNTINRRIFIISAAKVVISGIDKIVGRKSPTDEYQYFKVVKNLIDKRFDQIIRKRGARIYKTSQEKK